MSDYLNYTIENDQVYEHRDILEIPIPSVDENTAEDQPVSPMV